MYHIYCDVANAAVFTPDYNDAIRQFRKMGREYPNEVVDCDKLHDFIDQENYGRRERIIQQCPN